MNDGSEAMVEESKEKDMVLAAERHKSLFKDIKVFLNREVMRMSLTFVIRLVNHFILLVSIKVLCSD